MLGQEFKSREKTFWRCWTRMRRRPGLWRRVFQLEKMEAREVMEKRDRDRPQEVRRLGQQTRSSRVEECVVCMGSKASHIILPCMHLIPCKSCSKEP